jgi:hypothetical protein
MAIQISGTEVISNSRGLNNIASVDATTAASISAAGVGGGGGTHSFTASGAISAGDVVVLNSNGTVSTPTVTAGTQIERTRYSPYTGSVTRVKVSVGKKANGTSDVAHETTNDSNNIRLKAGLGVSGSVDSSYNGYYPCPVNVPNSNDVIMVYNASSNQYTARIDYRPNNGTSYSSGTSNTLTVNNSYPALFILYDETHDQYVLLDFGSGNVYSRVGTLSGETITWGSSTNIISGSTNRYYASNYAYIDQDNGIIAVCAGPRIVLGQLSAGSISYGTAVTLNTQTNYWAGQISINGSGVGMAFFSVQNNSGTSYAYAWPFTYSGTTITAATSSNALLLATSTSYSNVAQYAGGIYIPRLGGWVSSSYDSSGMKFQLLQTDGSTTPTSSRSIVVSAGSQPRGGKVYVIPEYDTVVVRDQNQTYEEVEYESDVTDAGNWIGIATSAISDTASGDVTVLGGVNDQQSGLTVNTSYYVDSDGSLITAGSRKIGKAISATELLITEGNA